MSFSYADLRYLAQHSQVRDYAAGEFVFHEGEPGNHLYLIRRGQIEIVSPHSSWRRLAVRGPGEVIGEMALLDTGVRSASARAVTPSRLRSLDRSGFELMLERQPKLALRLSQLLSNRMRDMQHDLVAQVPGVARVGHNFGAYLLEAELGHGGMGGVYRARRPDGPAVALKVIQSHHTEEDDEVRIRFEREGEMLARLDHPHIVKVLDQGHVGPTPYMVMELIEGESLSARIKRGPLSLAEVEQWLLPVARALAYSHSRQVFHRDVKPDNILRSYAGEVKLLDFGLAREEDQSRLSQSGKNLGTPNYFAPERAGSHHPELDRYADQYSYGVTLFQALTGELPFNAPDPVALLMHHLKTPPPLPSSLRPELKPEVDALVLRLLAKEPWQRFPDMEEVGLALLEVTQGQKPDEPDGMSQTLAF